MFHRPEKVFVVSVHAPLLASRNLLPYFAHGILRRSPSPISEVGFIEHWLEDRVQPIEQRLLAHPVINCRDPQSAKLTWLPRLRGLYLPHRLSPINAPCQFTWQSTKLLFDLHG